MPNNGKGRGYRLIKPKAEDDYTDPSTGKPYSDGTPSFPSRAESVSHARIVAAYGKGGGNEGSYTSWKNNRKQKGIR